MALVHPRLTALLTTAALAAGAVAGCGDEEEPAAAAGEQSQVQAEPASPVDEAGETNVTVAEVLRTPDRYLGDQVTISGQVVETVVEPGAFTIGTSGARDDEQLIVLPTADARYPEDELQAGDVVVVEGAIETVTDAGPNRFLYEEAEPKAGFLGRYLDRPGIVAGSVDVGDAASGEAQGTDGAG